MVGLMLLAGDFFPQEAATRVIELSVQMTGYWVWSHFDLRLARVLSSCIQWGLGGSGGSNVGFHTPLSPGGLSLVPQLPQTLVRMAPPPSVIPPPLPTPRPGCDWGLACLVNRRLAGPQGLWVTGLVLAPTPGQHAEKEEEEEGGEWR